MDTRPVTADAVARRQHEILDRCDAANARAKEAVRRAEAALAISQDRLRRAQATLAAIRARGYAAPDRVSPARHDQSQGLPR